MFNMIPKKSFFGAAIGTMIEYYDYALFSIFLPIIAPLFFPADTAYQSLVKGYFVLLITMIARPLGGLWFGHIGDVYGRRKALLTSMYGIAAATVAIGLAPSYQVIGSLATVIIVIAKSLQIFCFGGEYNGAGIYVVEHARPERQALVGSLLTATTLFGSLIASVIGIIVTAKFMPAWSWRIAFMLGGLIAVFGILYRKNLLEPPGFTEANPQREGIRQLIKKFPAELLAGMFIGGYATAPFTTVILFVNPVLMTKGLMDSHQLMLLQTLFIFIAIICLIPTGIVADKIAPRKVMSFSYWCMIILAYPLLHVVDHGNIVSIIFAMSGLIILNEILLGPSNAYLKSIFPEHYRYRGSSLGFTVGMSLLGGLTPIIENYLYKASGQFAAIAVWLGFIAAGGLVGIYLVGRKHNKVGWVERGEAQQAGNC
jgi:MFS transporter, MHS family, proline/betaine transporter